MTETKVCTKCGRELPLSDFPRKRGGKKDYFHTAGSVIRLLLECGEKKNKEKYASYQREYLKNKNKRMKTMAMREKESQRKAFLRDVLGGYRIFILNYTANGEYTYNIVKTSGEVFKTNDKDVFLSFIKQEC